MYLRNHVNKPWIACVQVTVTVPLLVPRDRFQPSHTHRNTTHGRTSGGNRHTAQTTTKSQSKMLQTQEPKWLSFEIWPQLFATKWIFRQPQLLTTKCPHYKMILNIMNIQNDPKLHCYKMWCFIQIMCYKMNIGFNMIQNNTATKWFLVSKYI